MSDRIDAFTVVLGKDIHEEDAQKIADAIAQFRGVIRVERHVTDIASAVANARARLALGDALFKVVYGDRDA